MSVKMSMAEAAYLCGRQGVSSACCGMIFNTKGFADAANSQVSKLESALVKASKGGVIPIVCDTSPCLGQLKTSLSDPALKCAPLPSLPCTLLLA